MKLRMHEKSLFAVLLRSPWWASFVLAAGVFMLARLMLPNLYAAFVGLPFAAIGAWAAWQQLRAPSGARIAERLAALREMHWEEFSARIDGAYRSEGYEVTRLSGAQADFALEKSGRTLLLACKRWKATRTGVEPLKELHAAGQAREASECMYLAAGGITDTARAFAAQKGIRLVEGAALVALLPRAPRAAKPARAP